MTWEFVVKDFPLNFRMPFETMRMSSADVRSITKNHREVYEKLVHFQFDGQGQRETPVADLATMIEVIMLFPGSVAAGVRNKLSRNILPNDSSERLSPKDSPKRLSQKTFSKYNSK